MGRIVKDSRLETREARRRLPERKEPYWRLIIEGVHIGYYRGKNGGMWYARVRLPEKKYRWETLTTSDDSVDANGETILSYAQAQEKVIAFADQILRGSGAEELKTYTVANAVDEYLTDFKANGKKSLSSTEAQINAHILPTLGDRVINTISFKELNIWKNNLATTEKRARSSKKTASVQKYIANENNNPEYDRKRRATANRILTILKAVLNHAYNNNHVSSDQAWEKLKPFNNVSEARIRFLSEPETIRLLNACDPDFRLLVRGALLSGMRYGELTALKVNDYNSDNHTLFISQSKSGKSRHVPLNQEGINFFNQLIIGKTSEDLIFTRNNGSTWKKNYQVRPLETACDIAKITPSITFHVLRHTYASALAMKGVPLQVIATVLGHSDTRITHKHYAHLMPSYIADVIKEFLPNFGETEDSNVLALDKKLALA
jgi:integrase